MQQDIEQKVLELAECLIQAEMMVATAESCTGGMLAQSLTHHAGSSRWFDRCLVSYSYEAKYEMLGVKPTTIMAHGAVSQECVEEMALGCLQQSHAQLTVAISGVAGPDGGTPHKPVGSVWIAWVGHQIPLEAEFFQFQGNREAIREQATLAAIDGMLFRVKSKLATYLSA
jgi:nicotinamide-nucleotide amidase